MVLTLTLINPQIENNGHFVNKALIVEVRHHFRAYHFANFTQLVMLNNSSRSKNSIFSRCTVRIHNSKTVQ